MIWRVSRRQVRLATGPDHGMRSNLPPPLWAVWRAAALLRGRSRLQADLAALFDADWYRRQARDIGDADPIAHFLSAGFREGYSPHPLFDTKWYLVTYPEIAAAGVNPLIDYIE